MPNSSVWESLRINFCFGCDDEEARIYCTNCDDNALASNPDQVIKWAKRHVESCPGLIEESDPSEIGFDLSSQWYEEKEILSDDD